MGNRTAGKAISAMFAIMLAAVAAQAQQQNANGTTMALVKNQESAKAYFNSVSAQLSREDIDKVLRQAVQATHEIASGKGLRSIEGTLRPGKFHIYIVDRQGKAVGTVNQEDAWVGSLDIALGKARTAAFFSSNENALTSRDIGKLSQPGESLWGIGNTNHGSFDDKGDIRRNALVTFPGGVPLYKDGKLVGAIGVSGDGVDQDEAVAFAGAQGFLPAAEVGHVSELKAQVVEKIAKRR